MPEASLIDVIVGYFFVIIVIVSTFIAILVALYGIIISFKDIFFNKKKRKELENLLNAEKVPFKCKICNFLIFIFYAINSIVLLFGSKKIFFESFNVLLSIKCDDGVEITDEIRYISFFILLYITVILLFLGYKFYIINKFNKIDETNKTDETDESISKN